MNIAWSGKPGMGETVDTSGLQDPGRQISTLLNSTAWERGCWIFPTFNVAFLQQLRPSAPVEPKVAMRGANGPHPAGLILPLGAFLRE